MLVYLLLNKEKKPKFDHYVSLFSNIETINKYKQGWSC